MRLVGISRTVPADTDPFDLDGIAARDEDRRLRAKVAAENDDEDTIWEVSTPRGRRSIRRQLREAGVSAGNITTSFHSNYGQMCFNEGLRVRGLQTYSRIVRLVSEGRIPLEHLQLLLKENDQ